MSQPWCAKTVSHRHMACVLLCNGADLNCPLVFCREADVHLSFLKEEVCFLQLGGLLVLGVILAIRGAAGAAALTHPVINNLERDFYTLQSLPELIELAIVCIPTLLARIGKASFAWPTAHMLTKRSSKKMAADASHTAAPVTVDASGKSAPPV